MINKNLEVDDYVKFNQVIFNDENVLVSQKFAEALNKANKLTEVGEDYVKVFGFDEKIPKKWVKDITRKHKTVEECIRATEINNQIHTYENTRLYRFYEFLTGPINWFIVSVVFFLTFMVLAYVGLVRDISEPLAIIGSIVICAILFAFYAKFISVMGDKRHALIIKTIRDVIDANDISYEEARKCGYDIYWYSEFFTDEEAEKGEEILPYYVWKPTKLNPDDNKPKFEPIKIDKKKSSKGKKNWRFK